MRRILFLLAFACLAAACKNKDSFRVNGVIKGDSKKYIYINRVDVNTPVFIDSAKISKGGAFSFKVKASEPDFYQLGFSTGNFITLLADPGEKIGLSFNSANLYESYTVTGSEGSSKLRDLDNTLAVTKRKLDSLSTLYANASKEPGFDIKGPSLETGYNNLIKAQRKKNIEFIINNINSLAAIKALYQTITTDAYVLYEPNDIQYLKIVTDSLTRHYPNSRHVQALARDLKKEMDNFYAQKLETMANKMPQVTLDPKLLNLEGNRIALSSLHGKYVLLTFWSVRSAECIQENLQLKQLYKLYNKKGFEIYQINLDANETAWKTAVRYDELPWISTREDDPVNPANARLFNVTSLPSNYLFDREGKIIATNLHDRSLQLKLEQLFIK